MEPRWHNGAMNERVEGKKSLEFVLSHAEAPGREKLKASTPRGGSESHSSGWKFGLANMSATKTLFG